MKHFLSLIVALLLPVCALPPHVHAESAEQPEEQTEQAQPAEKRSRFSLKDKFKKITGKVVGWGKKVGTATKEKVKRVVASDEKAEKTKKKTAKAAPVKRKVVREDKVPGFEYAGEDSTKPSKAP